MELYCAWHKKFFLNECDTKGAFYIGKKEPLSNPLRTDGICPRCFELYMKELRIILSRGVIQ